MAKGWYKQARDKGEATKSSRETNSLRVEGSGTLRKHRHVTLSPSRHHDINDSVHVTKIELVLEEAPDDTVGSMPSELDATAEINSTYPDGIPVPGPVVVRAEEALIVVLVLLLWVAAIALFFNRWGKIRMLEPYQPKFQQQHRQSCAIDPNPLQTRSYSKFNIHCAEHLGVHQASCSSGGQSRPRQNSVIVGSSSFLLHSAQGTPRRTKSAFDIQSLVLAETSSLEDKDDVDSDMVKSLRPPSESTRLLLGDRRTSLLLEKAESFTKPLQRERGMSICQLASPMLRDRQSSTCQFDRMDVLATTRPMQTAQRERGMSICYFDRTDVLAGPPQKDRCGNSTCHFDRMDVLARATPYVNKSLSRERRVSICNFVEREDELAASGRGIPRDRRSSAESGERNEMVKSKEIKSEKLEVFAKCTPREKSNPVPVYHYDRPSCSKTPDPVLGYKATCV